MRHVVRTSSAFVAVWALGTTPAGAQTATAFQVGAHKEPIVAVRVNGQGPYPFVLDTGSTHSVVTAGLARLLTAPIVAQTATSTSLGGASAPVRRIDRLELGPVAATGLLVTEVSDAAVDPAGSSVGIVGQDVLGDLVYTIDFSNRRIEWGPVDTARSASPAAIIPLKKAHDRFLAELPQKNSTLWLVPDSGAETLVLYERPDSDLPPLKRGRGFVSLESLTNQQTVELAALDRLRVGEANLRNVPAVLVRREDPDPSAGDGLLPLALFSRVTFDGPRRRLLVFP